MTAFDEKIETSDEVYTYLMENFSRYLIELFTHALPGASEHEVDELVGTALGTDVKMAFFDELEALNVEFTRALNSKKAEIMKHLNAVKGGKDLKKKHDKNGRIVKDEDGNEVIT